MASPPDASSSETTHLLLHQTHEKLENNNNDRAHESSSDVENNNNNELNSKAAMISSEDVVPTWNETMTVVLPYLRPIDTRHWFYALFALVSVVFGKILNVLPPLAIKYAVDAIATNQQQQQQANDDNGGNSIVAKVIYAILVYFVLNLGSMMNYGLQDMAQRTVALDAEKRFGIVAFGHLHTLSLSYHLEKHIGEITQLMNRGVESMAALISSFLFYILPSIVEVFVVTAMFWKLQLPLIALSTLVAVAAYVIFSGAITQTRIAYRRHLNEAADNVSQKEAETLVNYETVAMFGRTQHEVRQYGILRQVYKTCRVRMLSYYAAMEFGQKLIRLVGVCTGLVIAALAATNNPNDNDNTVSAGSFVVIQIYVEQLFQPLTMLGRQYRILTQGFTDLEKTVTMLQRVPEVQDLPGATVWKTIDDNDATSNNNNNNVSGEIVFANVSFHYKTKTRHRTLGSSLTMPSEGGPAGKRRKKGGWVNKEHAANNTPKEKRGFLFSFFGFGSKKHPKSGNHVEEEVSKSSLPLPLVKCGGVDDLSFTVPAGKTTALVGPSGAGKTTIIRLVLRLYDPDSGTVHVDGQNVKHLTQQSLRENIGVVAQDTILFNTSLRNNITFGKPDATNEEVWSAVETAALGDFVRGLPQQLDTLVGERGMKLSGGERQRVGLARCIIKDPKLILLDEATSSLDSATEQEIQKNISKVFCVGKTTTLMIAHRLSTARYCADKIIVLDKGKICEQGTHEELLQLGDNGKYAKMWQIQVSNNSNPNKSES